MGKEKNYKFVYRHLILYINGNIAIIMGPLACDFIFKVVMLITKLRFACKNLINKWDPHAKILWGQLAPPTSVGPAPINIEM